MNISWAMNINPLLEDIVLHCSFGYQQNTYVIFFPAQCSYQVRNHQFRVSESRKNVNKLLLFSGGLNLAVYRTMRLIYVFFPVLHKVLAAIEHQYKFCLCKVVLCV